MVVAATAPKDLTDRLAQDKFNLHYTVAELRAKGYRFVTTSALLGMGKPQRTMNGYFTSPGDNKALDSQFGVDGTGRHTPFNGN